MIDLFLGFPSGDPWAASALALGVGCWVLGVGAWACHWCDRPQKDAFVRCLPLTQPVISALRKNLALCR